MLKQLAVVCAVFLVAAVLCRCAMDIPLEEEGIILEVPDSPDRDPDRGKRGPTPGPKPPALAHDILEDLLQPGLDPIRHRIIGQPFRGRVMGVDGTPVAGARVRILEPLLDRSGLANPMKRANQEGWFSLDPGADVRQIRVRVTAAGFCAVEARAARHQILWVALHRGVPLQVSVVDRKTADPIAGVRVMGYAGSRGAAFGAPPVDETVTDARGRATLVMPAESIRLVAMAEGYAPALLQDFEPGHRGTDVYLPLDQGGQVVGNVVDRDDNPVAGACVQAIAFPWYRSRQVTGADGRFQFKHVPLPRNRSSREGEQDPLQVLVTHPDYAPAEGPVPPGKADRNREVSVCLLRGKRIVGRVVRKDGTPIAGVVLQPDWCGSRSMTDVHGGFTIETVPHGQVQLTATGNGVMLGRRRLMIFGDKPLEKQEWIVEDRTVDFGVRSLTSGGRPIKGARVSLVYPEGGLPVVQHYSDEGGLVLFKGRLRKKAVLLVEPPGMAPVAQRVDLQEAELDEVKIKLGAGEISGRILGPDLKPAGVGVFLAASLDAPDSGLIRYGDGTRLDTDAEGRFRFRGVGPGRYRISLSPSDRKLQEDPGLLEAGSVGLDLHLAEPGNLRAKWFEIEFREALDQVPVRGVIRVEVLKQNFDLDGEQVWQPILMSPKKNGAPGFFCSSKLERGVYDLRLDFQGYRSAYVKKIRMHAQEQSTSIRWLLRSSGLVEGRVLDRAGNPVPDAHVFGWSFAYLKQDDDVTDEDGRFELSGFEEGKMTVRVGGPFVQPVLREIETSIVKTTRVTIKVEVGGAIRLRFSSRVSAQSRVEVKVTSLGDGSVLKKTCTANRLEIIRDWIKEKIPVRFIRDLDAEHTFQALVPGRYLVDVIRDSRPLESREVQVRPGECTTVWVFGAE